MQFNWMLEIDYLYNIATLAYGFDIVKLTLSKSLFPASNQRLRNVWKQLAFKSVLIGVNFIFNTSLIQ